MQGPSVTFERLHRRPFLLHFSTFVHQKSSRLPGSNNTKWRCLGQVAHLELQRQVHLGVLRLRRIHLAQPHHLVLLEPVKTRSSLFGGTATGVFGATQASPLGSSAPTFGASSAPAFGSTPAFGSGASVFGQKPATPFGGFGSTPPQANPFGSATFGQSQPAFGSPSFGSTTPAFGASTSAFGSTPFGSTPPAFGASSAPAFGAATTPAFGASSAPAFGASSAPAFGASSTSLFGSTTPAFGQSASTFGSSTAPAFGSTSVFGGGGSSPFGASTTPAFGSSPSFGASTFTSPSFGAQASGSRATPYVATTDAEAGVSGQIGKLMSICAIPAYKNKSPEELRWEDYQAGDKGGPSPLAQQQQQTGGLFGQAAPASPFGAASVATPTPNPFGSTTSNLFGSKPAGPFAVPSTGSAFSSSSPFGSLTTGSAFGQPTSSAFGSGLTSSPFGTGSTPAFGSTFGSSSSAFGTPTPSFTSTPFSTANIFSSGTSTFGSNPFAQSQASSSLFPGSNQPFGSSASAFNTPALGSNIFGSSSSMFSASKPQTMSMPGTSLFGGIQPNPAQQQQSFGFPTLGQSQPQANSFGATPTLGGGLTSFAQQPSVPVPVTNPFGTLPALPQMSIGRSAGMGPSVQYGISSLPVSERPAQVRSTSLLTPRHITRSRFRMQARRYHPNKDSPKLSFFSDGEEGSSTPKADALFVPRENPRALFIRPQPLDHSPSSPASASLKIREIGTPLKQGNGALEETAPQAQGTESPIQEGPNTSVGMTSSSQEATAATKNGIKSNGTNGTHVEHTHRGNGYMSITGHRAGEAAVAYEHGADIEALMPKLRHSDYYVKPRVQELAAKERAEPGYCRRVKGFEVGRQGYGLVRFLGETDVRGLDLESIIQFNRCEVLVYMDETKKPPPGVGLNKPAEITLLNVKYIDKKSGQHLSEGPEVEKFEKKLKKKTEEQGAEFISYDAVKGEWTFRVLHFSKYGFEERVIDAILR
ncbi:hypothetical protein GOP47_0009436 [Adiantum capillus-veneris]|uniref:Nucleoporin autopeptidase n=1 Tax=Adiantum capillus-veneris TaxID=13818 RepID=A0A9D4UW73_ADICA|nr:hypothetical protein GOP47_0009436 [Adiantum capillus-veneris]